MGGFRRAARTDGNQKEIVSKLRACGFSVLHTHQLKNCFDILVGAYGLNFAFEIKDPEQPKSSRKLTNGEQEFFDSWRGQVNMIETFEEALDIIKGRKLCKC